MVNNQNEFNKEYSKKAEVTEIMLEDEEEFVGELVVENYAELENLYLRDNQIIEKVVLRNLKNLKNCEIWKCGIKELVVEKCPQIKVLDIRNNSLTSLEFLKDLNNLEELKLDGNAKLTEILEPYGNDWKSYQKDLQASDKNTLELLKNIRILEKKNEDLSINFDLSKKNYSDLKNFLKEVLILLSQDAKKDLVEKLDKKIKEKGNDISAPGMTEELKLITKSVMESAKEMKKELEKELAESKTKIEELEKIIVEQNTLYKEKEMELNLKQKEADKLLDRLLEKSAEKGRTIDEGEKEKLQKEIDNLKKKLDETKEREYELRGEVKSAERELKRAEDEINYLRSLRAKQENLSNESPISPLVSQLKINQSLTQQEISQVNNFLTAKQSFIAARQETIQELKQCLTELEKSFSGKKRTAFGEVGNVVSKTGGAVGTITFGIPRAIGEIIIASNNFSKIKLSKKTSEQFQIFLGNEENEITQLNQAYDSLINDLNLKETSTEAKLFRTKYKVFDIVIKDGVWENRPLTIEKMEKVIISLSENLSELKDELEKEIKELSSRFGTEKIKININLEELKNEQKESQLLNQQPIQTTVVVRTENVQKADQPITSADREENKKLKQKESELNNLINSAKQKIDRNLYDHLKLLLEQQVELVHQQNINASSKEVKDLKKDLQETKRKLLKELKSNELENICQKQIEITKLKIQLTDLQTQSSRIEQSTST